METLKKRLGPLGGQGSEKVQQRLLGYLRGERLHPAIILAGPERATKLEVAKGMAKFLLCSAKGNRPFCGQCSPCRRIDKGFHPDVIVVTDEEEDNIKIDSVRDLCHQMEIAPIEASVKICIIDECHRMNTAAANAFLKTLEEPNPGRYFFLLTSQVGSLLPTILSRCLQFMFKPESEVIDLDPERLKQVEDLIREFLVSKNANQLVTALQDKDKAHDFLKVLQWNVRAALVAPHGVRTDGPSLFGNASSFDLMSLFDGALRLEGRLRSNANHGLMLESFLRQSFK